MKIATPFIAAASLAALIGFAHATYAYGRAEGRAAAAELDAGSGVDPVVVSDHAPAPIAPAAPAITQPASTVADDPAIVDTIWSLWERGLITPALMLMFHLANTIALARWSWLSSLLPWLANRRWLAILSAVQGATAGLVPLAVAGDIHAQAIVYAFLIAAAQFIRPTPKTVTVATVEAAEKIEPLPRAVVVKQ